MRALRGLGLRFRLRRMLGLRTLADHSSAELRSRFPEAPALTNEHVRRCRVLPSREHILDHLPPGSVGVEVGSAGAEFSVEILERVRPTRLHLIDIEPHWVEVARERLGREISDGRVTVHMGASHEVLEGLEDASLDWAYIDANHEYPFVKRDLELARRKVKPNGWIVLNDYCFYGFYDATKYGVVEAVHEFCLEHDWEFVFLALQGASYQDVALRRIGIGERDEAGG